MDRRLKVICDTDLGDDIDDAYTLIQLMYERNLEILGITTVYRNARERAKNVSRLLELFKKNIPVYIGADFPEIEKLKPFSWVEKDERGVWGIPYSFEKTNDLYVQSQSAIDFMLEMLNKYPNEITILAIGPLTNLALVFKKDAESFRKAKEILLMGGNYKKQEAEWNIACDPEAAQTVFSSGVPIKAVGIEITRNCVFGEKEMEKIRGLKSEKFQEMIAVTEEWINQNQSYKVSPTMHDVLTAGELFYPVCKFKKEKVKVGTTGVIRGCTLIDADGDSIEIAYEADCEKFIQYQIECLENIDKMA